MISSFGDFFFVFRPQNGRDLIDFYVADPLITYDPISSVDVNLAPGKVGAKALSHLYLSNLQSKVRGDLIRSRIELIPKEDILNFEIKVCVSFTYRVNTYIISLATYRALSPLTMTD